jgi:hypothetical protein
MQLLYIKTIDLHYDGDCHLLGVTPDLTIYVEEVYTPDAWIAQHRISPGGDIVTSVDEQGGEVEIQPLRLPADLVEPQPVWQTAGLNFTGPRLRGLREPERAASVVQPIEIGDKIVLVERLNLPVMPPLLLGLAESYVVAEAALHPPRWYVVCRRIRLAYALTEARMDSDGLPYDYDSLELYAAHLVDLEQADDLRLLNALDGLPGPALHRPMDCVIVNDHLVIADGGGDSQRNRVHLWQIELPS